MLKLPTFSFMGYVYVGLNLALSVALSTVPTITNVNLTCRNFKNVLYWNYSAPDLKPEFTVTIRGYQSEEKLVSTKQTYLELSKYTQNAGELYYIQVEAQGKSSENVSEGFSFSYNDDFPADIKCLMDFPELTVSVLQRRIKLSFLHPYHVHNHEALEYEFEFTVYYNKTAKSSTCFDDDDPCTVEFWLSESLYGNCMNVQIDGSVKGIRAKTDRKVCDHEAPHSTDWTLLLTILLCSGFGFLFLIIMGVMMYKNLTRPDSQNTFFQNLGIVKHHLHVPEQPPLSELMSVGHTPLLITDQTFPETSSPGFEESSHIPTHFKFDVKLPDEQDDRGVIEEGDSEDINSGNSFSGYDSQKFPLDMGQGDIVEAYGPR